jgi:hypothetical protein
MIMNYWKPAAVAVCCTFVIACGSESGAPAGSTVEIQLAEKEWAYAGPITFVDQPVIITVRGGNGNPVNDVDVTVSLDLSSGTVPLGDEAMFLFEDNDRNGVPDSGVYSGPVPPTIASMSAGALALPYLTSVGAFGSKQFVLRMSLGAFSFYRGNLNAVSGSAFGISDLCQDGDPAAPPTC